MAGRPPTRHRAHDRTPATYRANYSEVVCAAGREPRRRLGLRRDQRHHGHRRVRAAATPARSPARRGPRPGRFGSALTFDGVNDLVTVADSASLDLTNRATLEAWVNPTALGAAWRTALLKEQPGQLVYALYANNDFEPAVGPPLHDGRPGRERHRAAAAERVVAPGDDLGRHHAAAVRERRAGGRRAPSAARS